LLKKPDSSGSSGVEVLDPAVLLAMAGDEKIGLLLLKKPDSFGSSGVEVEDPVLLVVAANV
jgi:hypothetical protein